MRKLFCLVGVCVFALGASPAMANGGKEFEVDDDRAQCKKAGFTSIQAAVDAAAARPGKETIVVCPGLYQEQVRIEGPAQDGLRLEAKKHTKLERDVTADPAREAIIKFPAIDPAHQPQGARAGARRGEACRCPASESRVRTSSRLRRGARPDLRCPGRRERLPQA